MKSTFSYQALEKSLGFKKTLPVTENWSAAADFLKIISDHCLNRKPEIIVECSSGTSSLILAKCCQLNNHGHVYSLENGEEFALQTQAYLTDHSLSNYSDVIFSPLKEYSINGEIYNWYDFEKLPELEINMLVVDGPPGFIQKKSRYPAAPLLSNMMAKDCIIFLDDAAREDEKGIVELWLRDAPDFQLEYIDNQRGCAILTR